MDYLSFPVGNAGPRSHVQVMLRGHEADVYLVDSTNAARYERTGQAQGVGAYFGTSPITLQVPHRANWYVLVVPRGGRVEASVQLISMAS